MLTECLASSEITRFVSGSVCKCVHAKMYVLISGFFQLFPQHMTETIFSLVTPYVIKIYFFAIHIIILSI